MILNKVVYNNATNTSYIEDLDLHDYYTALLDAEAKSTPVMFQRYTKSDYLKHPACHLWNYALDDVQGKVGGILEAMSLG